MSPALEVLSCGPLITVQDGGRPGWLGQGLALGGAADLHALDEAAALLGGAGAAIELPGVPLRLRCHGVVRLAFTGAQMRAEMDGRELDWHAAHTLPDGAILDIRPTGQGVYAYVTPADGLATEPLMGSRAAHLIAGIGAALAPGDLLRHGGSTAAAARRLDPVPDRFSGGILRLLPTPQTRLFSDVERERFVATAFTRDPRGNRQGVRLAMDGPGFATERQLNLLSDFVLPGDVQMTGDGVPYILGPECQTTGGYPRIGTVIAADLPRALQAPPGARLRFRFVTLDAARAATPSPPATRPLLRRPDAKDLLNQQLIGGVVSAKEE
ncbi:MAG: biotin-dependent carboxyltransferase family protein [Pseudomonadota bacterium]